MVRFLVRIFCAAVICTVGITASGAVEYKKGLILSSPPKPVPELEIRDGNGQSTPLSALVGRPILVNLWASWCAPCVAELPALDRVMPKLQELGVVVMPLSLDRGGKVTVDQTYARLEIKNLPVFLDHQRESGFAWEAPYLPVTLFVDAQGQEVARFNGAVQWDSPALWPLLDAFAKGRPLPTITPPPLGTP